MLNVLNVLALISRMSSDYARATALHEESLALARALDYQIGVAGNLSNLGVIARDTGDYARAAVLYADALALYRHLGDSWGIAISLTNRGEVELLQGSAAAAGIFYREALPLHQQMGHKQGIAECLEGLAFVANAAGGSATAVHLLGAADAIRQAIGYPLAPMDRAGRQEKLDELRTVLEGGEMHPGTDSPFERTWLAGRAMPLEQAVTYALSDLPAAATPPAISAPGRLNSPLQ
jgi:hypothetical protein